MPFRFITSSLLLGLLGLLGLLAPGCSYGDGAAFDDDGGGPFGSSASTSDGGSKRPEPQTCGDGTKNGIETDVDCGGACDQKCAVGAACSVAADCADANLCTAGACAAPNGTDQVKNGDESDVDCGGTNTGAPRCEPGKACAIGADCSSRGCGYTGLCVEAPSCATHLGGDTCGVGEIGSGTENHESCCKSLEVAGFEDPNQPGKTVYLDKYEVTAGRVREFITQITASQGGTPNVQSWIQANRPALWDDSWDLYLPAGNDGDFGLTYVFAAVGDGSADYSSGFYVHGQNCAIAQGRFGFPTYWQPDATMTGPLQGFARSYTQDILDVKSMSCISHAMLAAFCAWDGGQIATRSVLDTVTNGGNALPSPAMPINVSQDAGFLNGTETTYSFPSLSVTENASRVAAPGRIPQDAVAGPGGDSWMDLTGNLNEMALQSVQPDGFALLYYGLGHMSARALQNDEAIPRAAYKAAYSGGRCMRFR